MGLSAFLSLVAALSAVEQTCSGTDWEKVWSLLQSYHSQAVSSEEVDVALEELPVGLRASVAISLRGAAPGEAPRDVPCSVLPELGPGGAWAFALAISSGPALDQALLQALSETQGGLIGPILQRGYDEFLSHSEAARGVQALTLAGALHERADASWSGLNLAIARTRMGEHRGAAEVLTALLEGDLPFADRSLLMSRLSLVHLGEGGATRARGVFGLNLARGMGDSAVVLGLLSLESGHQERSRALFRSALSQDPGQAWAARGWSLSMVPR